MAISLLQFYPPTIPGLESGFATVASRWRQRTIAPLRPHRSVATLVIAEHQAAALHYPLFDMRDERGVASPTSPAATLLTWTTSDAAAVVRGERPWAVELGDARDWLRSLPDASVDAVITDPPYPREYVGLYEQIAAELPRVLRRGGSFLAIVPHFSLPEVLASVGQHLKYRWTLCMWQESGNHPRMAMGIEVVWKPVVWWVNGAWPSKRGFIRDGFVNAPPEKAHHKWEQSLTWAEYCLRFVPKGGLVLDPLCGAGTAGVACAHAGLRFIGVEMEAQHVATARARVKEAFLQEDATQ